MPIYVHLFSGQGDRGVCVNFVAVLDRGWLRAVTEVNEAICAARPAVPPARQHLGSRLRQPRARTRTA